MAELELTAIVLKYKEELADKNHQVICYKLLVSRLEKEVEDLKRQVTDMKGVPGEVVEELPQD